MSFFNFFSGDSKPDQPTFPWIPLELVEQLDEVIEQSYEKPVVIFKHSTRCSISRFALRQWENESEVNAVNYYLIDLLNFRPVSQYVAERFQIRHESPQIIVLKGGKVVSHASHQDIQWNEIKMVL